MVSSEQLGQDADKQFELARSPPDGIFDHTAGSTPVFNTLEQEEVLVDLPQLHELVAETLNTAIRFPEQRSRSDGQYMRLVKI